MALADHLDTNANMFAVRGAASHLHHVRLWECNSPDTSSHVQQTVDCVCVNSPCAHGNDSGKNVCYLVCFGVFQESLLRRSTAVAAFSGRGEARK